jgi:hypothetical protein
MPNWCNNVVYISHENPEKLEAIKTELEKGDDAQFFNSLVPNPSGEWHYDWSIENWGTKWDASVLDFGIEDGLLHVSFDTAWGPPTAFYQKLFEQEYGVKGLYYESGMCFAGIWEDGDDDYYEFSNENADELAELLPEELDEMFAISEQQRDYEYDEEELSTEQIEAINQEAGVGDVVMSDKLFSDMDNQLNEVIETQAKLKLKERLQTGVVQVTFTKKDGSNRVMLATLNEDLIPGDKKPKGTGKSSDNGNTFAVYDTEADGWRSFNFDTVTNINYD